MDHPSGEGALERGEHEFSYAIYPHKSSWKEARSYKTAVEFNNPLIAIKTPVHKGDLQKETSFLSVTPENLVMTAMKKSDGDLIARLYETTGERAKGKITLFKKACVTNLLEEKVKESKVNGKDVPIDIKPFEITTVRIKT
jgi:alpha-mannosidase